MGKFILTYVAYVAAINTLPGPWEKWKEGFEGKPLDKWSLTHVAWGAIARAMGVTFDELIMLSASNEVLDQAIRTQNPSLLWGEPESPANVAADIALNLVGFKLFELVD